MLKFAVKTNGSGTFNLSRKAFIFLVCYHAFIKHCAAHTCTITLSETIR